VREEPASIRCTELVSIPQPCSHALREPCCEAEAKRQAVASGQLRCEKLVTVLLPCGHEARVRCCDRNDPSKTRCQAKCGQGVATCGHPCARTCGERHAHGCDQACRVALVCGHDCQAGCGQPHTSLCGLACEVRCAHNRRCPRACWQACVSCREPCGFSCRHSRCTRMCFQPCDREPCQQR
jgi:hypothetical protein